MNRLGPEGFEPDDTRPVDAWPAIHRHDIASCIYAQADIATAGFPIGFDPHMAMWGCAQQGHNGGFSQVYPRLSRRSLIVSTSARRRWGGVAYHSPRSLHGHVGT